MEYARLMPGPGFLPLQCLLYYSQRLITTPGLRNAVVEMLRSRIEARQGPYKVDEVLTSQEQISLDALTTTGYAPLGPLLSEREVDDIHAFLSSKTLTSRQKPSRQFVYGDRPEGARMGDYSLKDIVACPHILELANSPSLLRLAARYIGCKPTISALGLRWSFPGAPSTKDVQAFHRDSEDWRYFKVFVYLTDVELDSGPHVYVLGTHTSKAPIRLRFYRDDDIVSLYGAKRLATVTGQRGFGFAADTAGIHKGAAPVSQARLMLQIQYSLLPAYAYQYRKESYTGSQAFDRYINRLFLQ